MKDRRSDSYVSGVPANKFIIPIAIVIAILHIGVIYNIFAINMTSGQLSTIMRNSGMYTQDATSLLAGASLLSETSTSFVMLPVTEKGELNVFPLKAYAGELANPRRGAQVVEKFEQYDLDDNVMDLINEAADNANFLYDSQIHAISLMNAVYPLPDEKPLTDIPLIELTDEEKKLSDEEKESKAKSLLLATEYALSKQTVSTDVNACVSRIQEISAAQAQVTSRRLAVCRMMMWFMTFAIIILLIGVFIFMNKEILKPLSCFVKLIPENKKLDDDNGIREVRLVASAYNNLLERRDALDNILRSAAETDTLTNMPNRYSYEQYKVDMEKSGYPVAVLLFDIDYLKQTNDTKGHKAGDNLIRIAAECISTCFSDETGSNCFRIGGDEFVAIVRDCREDMIQNKIRHFRQLQEEHDISVSTGYAYADDIGDTTFKTLMDEADMNMYDSKKTAHREQNEHVAEAHGTLKEANYQ